MNLNEAVQYFVSERMGLSFCTTAVSWLLDYGFSCGLRTRVVPCAHGGQIFLLCLGRTQIPQRSVFPETIIEHFDVVEDVGAQLSLIGKGMSTHCGGFVAKILNARPPGGVGS